MDDLEQHRQHLQRIAYRMLGSVHDAEDVAQEALTRALQAGTDGVVDVRAWLTRITVNVALDRLTSARARREAYVGPWLPEPVVGGQWSLGGSPGVDPADRVTFDEQVSLALLTVLETLSPAERAVYVLHEAFGVPLDEVASMVGRTPAASRQLAVRARRHIAERAPRFDPDRSEHARLVSAFQRAVEDGDLESLAELLDDGVVLRADGGGVVDAARRPVTGRQRVIALLSAGLRRTSEVHVERRIVNGAPGLVLLADGQLGVLAFVVRNGRITHIDVVANPDKLHGVPVPEEG
jgi:RNA polymerase sigma-70 factor (ECF subfamily)